MYGNGNLAVLLNTSAGAVVSLDYVATTSGGTSSEGSIFEIGGGGVQGLTILETFANFVTTQPQVVDFAPDISGWTGLASVSQFDSSLGTLDEVILNVGNTVSGAFSAENLEGVPASVAMSETAFMTVTTPYDTATGQLPVTKVSAADSDAVSLGALIGGYDGTPDFSGIAGQSDAIVNDPGSDSAGVWGLTDLTDLDAFTGTGSIALPVSTYGQSVVKGPSNLLTELTRQTGGTVSVSYVYTPASSPNDSASCFAEGTRIATPDGEVAVECLVPGQMVALAHGGVAPIAWIGRQNVDCSRHRDPKAVWPVLVRAGAFAESVPSRDLFLSPDHAVFADGVLIPVRCLLDGENIVQVARDRVRYFQVELPEHGLLLAEALAVESFLDTGVRHNFDNGGLARALHPNFAALVWEAAGVAPLVQTGPLVQAVRARLAARWTQRHAVA